MKSRVAMPPFSTGSGIPFSDLRVGRSLEDAYLEVLRAHGEPGAPGDPGNGVSE